MLVPSSKALGNACRNVAPIHPDGPGCVGLPSVQSTNVGTRRFSKEACSRPDMATLIETHGVQSSVCVQCVIQAP